MHPAPGPGATSAPTGCNLCIHAVQQLHPNVQGTIPEPSAAPARMGESPALDGRGGGPIGEFFTALGPGWRLTAAQRARLATAVTAVGPDFGHAASITAWSNALRLQSAVLAFGAASVGVQAVPPGASSFGESMSSAETARL